MLNFKLFFENFNQKKEFLSSHFKEPTEDIHLLAFADWLEDNGDEHLAQLLRMTINGTNDEESYQDWHNQLENLKSIVINQLPKNIQMWNNAFVLPEEKTAYRVNHQGIWKDVNGQLIKIPKSKWTEDIVKAATWLIINNLTNSYQIINNGDMSNLIKKLDKKPHGLKDRQLYQTIIKFSNILNNINYFITNLSVEDRNRIINQSIENIPEFLSNLIKNHPGGLSSQFPDEYQEIIRSIRAMPEFNTLPKSIINIYQLLLNKK
jgi:uncharacterized protein (TIGR02996 family)